MVLHLFLFYLISVIEFLFYNSNEWKTHTQFRYCLYPLIWV
jgi:hypothetical protein